MPYAPGIQDISGQLIAQGMSQAGAARARAIESIGESISGGMRQFQQNQLYTQQALGKFGSAMQDPTFKAYVQGIANDDPNAPQVPEPIKKAIKNIQAGKADIYDATLVGSLGQDFQQSQLVSAQARNLRAEAMAREAAAQRMTAALDRISKFREVLGGAGVGAPEAPPPALQPTVPAAKPVPPEVLKFAPSGAMAKPTAAMPKEEAPEAVGTFLQAAKPFAMPKAEAAPAPAAAAPSAPRAPAPSLEGGITLAERQSLLRAGMPREFVAAIPEQVPMQSAALAYEELLLQQSEGKPVTAGTFITSLQKQEQLRRQGLGESRELTLSEAQAEAERFNRSQQGVSPDLRQVARVRGTNRPGYYTIETEKGALTREEESAKAQQQAEREMRQKMIPAAYDDVRKQADDDRLITPQIRKLQSLYQGKKIEGKAFENLKSSFISIVKGLNFDVGEDLENAQGVTDLGRSLMNNLIVPYFNSLKGSTSNRDVDLIKSFGPQMTTNPQAAMAMLEIMDRRVEYNKAVQRQYMLFNAGRLTSADLSDKLIELQDRFEASIPEQSAFAEQFNLTAPEQATTRAGGAVKAGSARGLRVNELRPGINYRTGPDGLYYEFGKP
jgi:hypothetical protein